MKRVAYLTGEFPRASDTFIQREIAALRALGHEVLPCSIRRTGPEHLVGPEQRALQSETWHVLEAAKRPGTLLRALGAAIARPGALAKTAGLAWRTAPKGLRAKLWQGFYLIEALVLADMLRRRNVAHLHNHIAKASCSVAMLASELSGIPFSFTLHGPDIFFEPMHWRIDEKAARARFTICISSFARSQLMCFAAPEHWDRLHIVHCGVEPDRYGREASEKGPGTRLLFVGRLAGVKGVPLLVDAVRRLASDHPDVQLDLIGDGPDRAALEAKVTNAGLSDRIRFLGYRNQEAVADALVETDLFVLPSFAEGVPVVLMEAMAAGVPVVTTRIAGVPELVEDGETGLLVPAGNPEALTSAIATLITDPDRRRRMGAAGQRKVRAEFDSRREGAKLSALIEAET
ncbi:glycosyltransferase family 4 protein [Litorisediminicola beolgyonensis]|uniref:Glycosyltransferase family 4 protein n=1 Tax=Litorisediminicola beolgyonensis TaxID=1173614 RepID=A0ABW3ZIM6_9RHOB